MKPGFIISKNRNGWRGKTDPTNAYEIDYIYYNWVFLKPHPDIHYTQLNIGWGDIVGDTSKIRILVREQTIGGQYVSKFKYGEYDEYGKYGIE